METKICSKCKEEKKISEFGKRKDRKSGFASWCYKCKGESKSKKYYKDKLENPIMLWLNRGFVVTKNRAKRKNNIFAITKNDMEKALYENDKKCIYCNKEFDFHGTKTNKTSSPTIDRIIPLLGYVPNNIVIACHRCNSIKRDATFDEIITIGENLKKLINSKYGKNLCISR